MNTYLTAQTIKKLREQNKITQANLAEKLHVSPKTISKWETGKGFPDISLIEPLAQALHISVPELFAGIQIVNKNRAANVLRSSIYICPICGNIIHATGSAVISCCGITLPPQQAEPADDKHDILCTYQNGEYHLSLKHEMTKQHYISFIAYSTDSRFDLVKLYPEQDVQADFFSHGNGILYWYCNHHGLFSKRISPRSCQA